ncbi:MAG TPA: STAS domain-containing protein [Candidatus Cybelea sp.]|nr:STAS domain-containing protein [Candidatus Cybelea sp.]
MAVAGITESAGRLVVALEGEIDLEQAGAVRRALLDSLKKGRHVLVDLSQVTYIDSSGIASLVEGLQVARKQKNDLGLVAVSQRVRRVLELARLDKVFQIYADLAAAVGAEGTAAGTAAGITAGATTPAAGS